MVVCTMALLSSALGILPPGAARALPTYKQIAISGNSTLWEMNLPENTSYASGAPLVVSLKGSRHEIGRAYVALLGDRTSATFETFLEHVFPKPALRIAFEAFADWLWDKFSSNHIPAEFLEELAGMKAAASPTGNGTSIDVVTRRFNVLANLPADVPNLISMLEQELEKGLPKQEAALLNEIISWLDHCEWCTPGPSRGGGGRRARLPAAPRCDAFAAWGSRTVGGRLFASRNLDWKKNTGIAASKLVTVFDVPGTSGPYATFGFASGFGALAGMSSAGITVAEMNLDNSLTTFDGPPFPMRLRMILERSNSLAEAKKAWAATNNTDSMNYMITSSTEHAAVAIEAIGGKFASAAPHATFSAFFSANDTVEEQATCTVGKTRGGTCGTGFPDVPIAPGGQVKRIGTPLPEAVWRTNHALHPTIMPTQEPLFNDTTFRYALLKQAFDERAARAAHSIDDTAAIEIAATLGIKGDDFHSCDPVQFGDGTHVMSVVYAPRPAGGTDDAHAWVAWEDATPALKGWRPAACNPYVRIDFAGRFW